MQDKKGKIVAENFIEDDSQDNTILPLSNVYESPNSVFFSGNINYSWENNNSAEEVDDDSSYKQNTIVNALEESGNTVDMLTFAIEEDINLFDVNDGNMSNVNFIIESSALAYNNINILDLVEDLDAMKEDEDVSYGSLIYEETRGGDFLESAVEEQLPFFLDKSEEGSDIYKLAKDSLEGGSNVEIWDYDFDSAKIDLADFVEEYGDSFSFSVHQEENDVTLHLQDNSQNAIDIVFKDADFESNDLDNIIKSIIVDSSNKS